jgi:hypothetical protein
MYHRSTLKNPPHGSLGIVQVLSIHSQWFKGKLRSK